LQQHSKMQSSIACSFLLCLLQIVHGRVQDSPTMLLPYADWVGQKVLMIGAHPDDIEGTAGGTVALLTQSNIEVIYAIVTNGDKGCSNPFCMNYTAEQIAVTRQKEQHDAATVLGVDVSNVVMLDYEDAMVTSYPEQQIRSDIVALIRRFQPYVIMSWFPYPDLYLQPTPYWGDTGFHPDHQAVGRIVLASQFDAGLRLLWPTLGEPWKATEFYMWAFEDVTHYTDISTTLQLKVNSYLAHASQNNNASNTLFMTEWVAEQIARLVDVPDVSYAEGFQAYF